MHSDSDIESMDTVNSQESAISFDAIKGKQGIGDCYLVFIPFALLPKLPVMRYPDDCPPQEKAQRKLIKSHANGLRDYLVKESDSFMLPTLTASVVKDPDSDAEGLGMEFDSGKVTLLPGSKLVFNDGQHREVGARMAIAQEASLADKTLPVLLFPDYDLSVSQRMFFLIHAKQRSASTSLQVAYNTFEAESNFTNDLTTQTPILKAFTDREKTSLSGKNSNLFTLSLLRKLTIKMRNDSTTNHQQSLEFCSRIFKILTKVIPHWSEALKKTITAPEIRKYYVSTQSVTLQALAEIACELRDKHKPEELEALFAPLKDVEWEKSNPDWEGRVVHQSFEEGILVYKILSKKDNIIGMRVYLKVKMGLRITEDEYKLESLSQSDFFKSIPSHCLPEVHQLEISEFLEPTATTSEVPGVEEAPPSATPEVPGVVEEAPTTTLEVPGVVEEAPPDATPEVPGVEEAPPATTPEVPAVVEGKPPAIRRERKKPSSDGEPKSVKSKAKKSQSNPEELPPTPTTSTRKRKPKATSAEPENTETKTAVGATA